MDYLRPTDVSDQPRRSLWVKLKVPAVVLGHLQAQTEAAATAVQQSVSDLALKSPVLIPCDSVDSPQTLLVSFPTPHGDQKTITDAADDEGTPASSAHHDLSHPEVAPLIPIASLLDDNTTTAGASFPESAYEPAHRSSAEQRSDGFNKDLDPDCIRVSRPRSFDEDAPEPQPEAEPRHPHRVSIAISDLLRPVSEEPVAQDISLQMTATGFNVHVPSAAEPAYVTPAMLIATFANEAEAEAEEPLAATTSHADALQEPGPAADIAVNSTAVAPQTPQTVKVTLKLSPSSMAKYTASIKPTRSLRDYGRDRNPRRNATKAFGVVKTHEHAALSAKLRKEPVEPNDQAAVANTKAKKRGAQSNGDCLVAKRQKPSGTSPTTRSSRGLAVEPALIVESAAPPTFQLDLTTGEPRPIRDVQRDRIYVQRMISVLEVQSSSKTNDTAKEQSVTMKALLNRATYAGGDEALFLTTSEAMEHLAPGRFWNNVIVTAQQQSLPLQSIDQFLHEFYEEDVLVWIQDCSAKSSKQAPSIRQVSIKAVRERFAAEQPQHPKPWNLLELATHHEDGFRPLFLNNEDCRLLTKLKIPTAADHTRRKTYPAGFKEVEKWSLLAQAGALTLPHQDSHGYSTYITVNVGLVGFGWLSNPTSEKRAEWNKTTQKFIDGPWRYVVLKPGQTVYFPAGTVHFVFRLPSAGNTLAFGGHVLRCSNIVHWVRCLLEEVKSASVTNEDLTDSATGYLERVERFVLEARKTGNVERWGGEDSITDFLRLKMEFVSRKQKQAK